MIERKKIIFGIGLAAALTVIGSFGNVQDARAQQGQGAAPVKIVDPLPIPTLDNAARRAFQIAVCSRSFPDCNTPNHLESDFDVPTTDQLVIEYVSASCTSPTTSIVTSVSITTRVGGVLVAHRVPVQFQGATSTANLYAAGLVTRLYADSGTTVEVNSAATSGGSCLIQISGHFVPA